MKRPRSFARFSRTTLLARRRAKESGSCSNSRRVYLDDIEALAIKGLRPHLAHPEVITEFVDAYSAERKRLKKEVSTERTRIERRLPL